MKYKPCCGRRCLNSACETRDNGGCYCCCRIADTIKSLKQTINGIVVGKGCIYIPDENKRAVFINNMSEQEIADEKEFREVEAPRLLKKYENALRDYLIQD